MTAALRRRGTSRRGVLGAVLLAGLVSCTGYPRDPGATLERVRRRGQLRVGAGPASGWVQLSDEGSPGGTEPDLAKAFAQHLGVRPEWVVDGESGLVERLELGHLDLLVAGFTSDTSWSNRMGITRGYASWPDAKGKVKDHVMGVPLGENAFLGELERFLDAQPSSAKAPR